MAGEIWKLACLRPCPSQVVLQPPRGVPSAPSGAAASRDLPARQPAPELSSFRGFLIKKKGALGSAQPGWDGFRSGCIWSCAKRGAGKQLGTKRTWGHLHQHRRGPGGSSELHLSFVSTNISRRAWRRNADPKMGQRMTAAGGRQTDTGPGTGSDPNPQAQQGASLTTS